MGEASWRGGPEPEAGLGVVRGAARRRGRGRGPWAEAVELRMLGVRGARLVRGLRCAGMREGLRAVRGSVRAHARLF